MQVVSGAFYILFDHRDDTPLSSRSRAKRGSVRTNSAPPHNNRC